MTVATHNVLFQPLHQPAGRHAYGLAARVTDTFRLWRERVTARQAFAKLDRRDLQDLGLSQWAVELELAKPFWRG